MKKSVTILGAGESGVGAALLAKKQGYMVFVSDSGLINAKRKKILELNDIAFEEGSHDEEKVLSAYEIIKSPGIPYTVPVLQKALEHKIPVIDELEFAFRFTKARIIAITGTNGKTTTTLLSYHMLKEAGCHVALAGNIGHSLAAQLCDQDFDWIVLEVSSFQIDGFKNFAAHINIILNITPDHLDRYGYSLEQYTAAKMRLLQNAESTDYLIYSIDSEILQKAVRDGGFKTKPITISTEGQQSAIELKKHVLRFKEIDFELELENLPLKGKHNFTNIAAASQAALLAGLSPEDIWSALKTFKNAPHRMEVVAEIGDVQFVNDSKATNVDATYYALGSYNSPVIWIAGGVDKGNDYSQLDKVTTNVKTLICLGTDNSKLSAYYHKKVKNIHSTDDLKQAITQAFAQAEAGDTILLSPACASFDLFQNYEDRGNQFRNEVLQLKSDFEKYKASKV